MSNDLQQTGSERAEIIRRGANLPEDRWSAERVTAAVRLLPTEFQDPAHAIGFLAMAHSYGLDPFAKEIWGWENKGKLQTMVSRDGWVKILRRDPQVEGVQMDHVREDDDFTAERTAEGKMVVHHESNPFGGGRVVGAYALIRMADERPDIFQARMVEDYDHLRGKSNWREAEKEMLLTRVLSFAGRLATGASLHTEADFQLKEDALPGHMEEAAVEAEGRMLEDLRDEPEEGKEAPAGEPSEPPSDEPADEATEPEPESMPEPAEPTSESEDGVDSSIRVLDASEIPDQYHVPKDWRIEQVGDEFHASRGSGDDGTGEILQTADTLASLLLDVLPVECDVCGDRFATPQAKGGHSRTHSLAERKAAQEGGDEADGSSAAREAVEEGQASEALAGTSEGTSEDTASPLADDRPWTPMQDVDETYGEPKGFTLLEEATPEGYGVIRLEYGPGKYRYQGVEVDGGRPVAPVGERAAGRGTALEAVDEHSGVQGDLLDDVEDQYDDLEDSEILMQIYQGVEALGDRGSERVYEIAAEIQDVEEGATPKLGNLDRKQRIELLERMRQLS